MAIFCRHPKSVIVAKSNVIQFDQSGFPMRLETMECLLCSANGRMWNDLR